MNEQVKQKWLSALRSGDYKQTQLHLRTDNGFCCLGVLCDLYGKEHNVEWELANGDTYYEFQDQTASLPLPVVEWAGTGSHNPYIGNVTETLSGLNDTGYTFNKIADIIQEYF